VIERFPLGTLLTVAETEAAVVHKFDAKIIVDLSNQ